MASEAWADGDWADGDWADGDWADGDWADDCATEVDIANEELRENGCLSSSFERGKITL